MSAFFMDKTIILCNKFNMTTRFYIIIILFLSLTACSNGKKNAGDNNAPASINKIWEFKKLTPASAGAGPVWIGGNVLDLTNKDTLLFAYNNVKVPATKYPYKISGDTIYVQNKPSYKILKVTGDTLQLATIFKSDGADTTVNHGSVTLVYTLKK